MIVLLNKAKPAARRGKIVLMNASRRVKKGKPKNYIPEADVPTLAALYASGAPVEGEVVVIDTAQAADTDYNLSPSRWVGQGEDIEHAPIGEIVARLTLLSREAEQVDRNLAQMLERL